MIIDLTITNLLVVTSCFLIDVDVSHWEDDEKIKNPEKYHINEVWTNDGEGGKGIHLLGTVVQNNLEQFEEILNTHFTGEVVSLPEPKTHHEQLANWYSF